MTNTYHADAVKFPVGTDLTIPALAATDSEYLLVSAWVHIPQTQLFIFGEKGSEAASYLSLMQGDENEAKIFGATQDNYVLSSNGKLDEDAWTHVFWAFRTDANNAPPDAFYLNREKGDGQGYGQSGFGWNFAMNGMEMRLHGEPWDEAQIASFEIADLMMFNGVSANVMQLNGTIPASVLSLFCDTDNKPVDPLFAIAAFGAPLVMYSGNAATFPVNQGTAGTAVLTGPLLGAASSPSD